MRNVDCSAEKKQKTKVDASDARDKSDQSDQSDQSASKRLKRARCETEQRNEAAQQLSTEQMAKYKPYKVPTKGGQRLGHVMKLEDSLSRQCRCYCN